MRVPVPLPKSYRLLNHGPTVLVTSACTGRRNVMAAAWAMPIDFDPPKVAVVIAQGTFTRELVDATGEFALCVPTTDQLQLTWTVGSESGREADKFARHGIATEEAQRIKAPLVSGCAAWLECRAYPNPDLARDYDLFVAEVLAAWADDALYRDGEWRFRPDGPRTIHHLKGGVFFATGERIAAERG